MDWINVIVNSAVLHSLAQTLMHFAWQGLFLAVLLMWLLNNINPRHSQLRYCTSLITLILCVLAPIATFWVVYTPESPVVAIDVEQIVIGLTTTVSNVGEALNDSGLQSFTFVTTELLEYFEIQYMHGVLPFLALTWIAGVLLLSTKVTLQVMGVCQLPYQSTHKPEPQLQQMFERLLLQLNVSSATRLLVSDKVDVPMAIGWLKPVVLLPSSMLLGLTPGQLEMLLMHELAHVRRHDYIINFLQTLVELLLFFHPAVKWISKQIRMERECCCDDIAVAHVGNPVAYASTLTDAEMSRFHNIPELAMAASGSDLKRRILRVVGHTDCASSGYSVRKTGVMAAVSAIGIVLLILAYENNANLHSPLAQQNSLQSDRLSEVMDVNITELSISSDIRSSDSSLAQKPEEDFREVEQPETDVMTVTEPLPTLTEQASPDEALLATKDVDSDPVETTDSLIAEQSPQMPQDLEYETELSKVMLAELRPLTLQVSPEQIKSSLSLSEPEQHQAVQKEEIAAVKESNVNANLLGNELKTQRTSVERSDTKTIAKVIPPSLLNSEAPVYPRQALRRGLSDQVQVSFKVNTEGKVEDIVFEGSVHRSFKKSVRKALMQWQYQPALRNGDAVATTMQHVFSFAEPKNVVLATTGTRIDAK